MLSTLQRRLRSQRGFTLIELLIVVAIIAILAAVLIPNFLRARAQSQVSATKGNLKNMGTSLESYFLDFGQYPASTNALLPNYVRALPQDPCTGSAFGAVPGYTYTPGASLMDYVLQSNWASSGAGAPCWSLSNSNWAYTPGGGLSTITP